MIDKTTIRTFDLLFRLGFRQVASLMLSACGIYQLVQLFSHNDCNFFVLFTCIGGLGIQTPIKLFIDYLSQRKSK